MIKVKCLNVILILFMINCVCYAQSVEDYFHSSSNYYIGNKLNDAKSEITAGFLLDPNDARLNALLDKILEEEANQPKQQNSQDQQEGDQQEEQEQQTGEQNEEQKQEQNEEQQQAETLEENKDKMTKEDAERILEALKNDEQEKQKLRKPKRGRQRKTDKDW